MREARQNKASFGGPYLCQNHWGAFPRHRFSLPEECTPGCSIARKYSSYHASSFKPWSMKCEYPHMPVQRAHVHWRFSIRAVRCDDLLTSSHLDFSAFKSTSPRNVCKSKVGQGCGPNWNNVGLKGCAIKTASTLVTRDNAI